MSSLPEKQKGDTLTAADWNSLVRLASHHIVPPIVPKVLVYNDSGSDVALGGILGIDGPMEHYAPSDSVGRFTHPDEINLNGVEPTVADHLGKWVVPIDAVKDGGTSDCAQGMYRVRVYINSAADPCCDVIAAETVDDETVYLGTGESGA